ncbi:hypothetical protein [Streptomyces sp. NPDC091268]|uniref:hypothetical protein n=1 Tax=Streptomyces sp. NPDC091268 TaxID=3365979 RepID=UPI003826DFF2
MVDPSKDTFTDADLAEMRAMGRSGWEALLRTQPDGIYPDPYGRGTSYYDVTGGDYITIRHTQAALKAPHAAPDGRLYYDPKTKMELFLYEADRSYLLDGGSAPVPPEGPV